MKILIGSGGLAKDFLSYHAPAGHVILIDDYKTGRVLGYPIMGTIQYLIENIHTMIQPEIYNCIGSIGDNSRRNVIDFMLIGEHIRTKNINMASFMSKDVNLGNNVLINIGAQIHHDCILENHVVIGPGSVICGNVHIQTNVFIGAGTTIIQGVTIGQNSIIAAGSCVTKDVPANSIYGGVPAAKIKE